MRQSMLGTILRGLRSRALLSTGSVLLTALAIGAAVLGPIFQVAVTNSFFVTRLEEAPNPLTGLTWRYQPDDAYPGTAAVHRRSTFAIRSRMTRRRPRWKSSACATASARTSCGRPVRMAPYSSAARAESPSSQARAPRA